MSRSSEIEKIEEAYLKKELPVFRIGDTVRVNTRIKEGNKERIQAFAGTVIAKKGTGLSETFTVYRTAYGSCMDRVFLLHSPRIASIEVMRFGKVRRAKLNYLRGKSGKSAKVREQYEKRASSKKTEIVQQSPSLPEQTKTDETPPSSNSDQNLS